MDRFAILLLIAFASGQQLLNIPQQSNPGGLANPYPNYPISNEQYRVNLESFGIDANDEEVPANRHGPGHMINLYRYFPYYGGRYNYTTISVHGYIGFAAVMDAGNDFQMGPLATDWPMQSDPAMIAPYLCKQQADTRPGHKSAVYYRLVLRSSGNKLQQQQQSPLFPATSACTGKPRYVKCNADSDLFLDSMMYKLQQGVVGASTFRADAALVVTWLNTLPGIGNEKNRQSTYQLIWLTDQRSLLGYTIINYDQLGFDAADVRGNTRTGRCQAIFNGGNHTGLVQVDLSEATKQRPSSLADRSAIPHVVRGRYVHRVDDIVRPAGCSNKTGGTFPLLIYPNIVNMLGEMKVEVNGLCLNPVNTYVLMIEQRKSAPCEVLNPSIARCALPRILDWGTKTVYLQPQSGLALDEKAYVGYIYFVPPTLDPMRLDIGNVHEWFRNPIRSPTMPLSWYPRNFTTSYASGDGTVVYASQVELYVIGYKEARDDNIKKFTPQHRVLARIGSFGNNALDLINRWQPQQEHIDLNVVQQWYLDDWQRNNELFTYRFGYLKLTTSPNTEQFLPNSIIDLPPGLVSAPISLHWMWTLGKTNDGNLNSQEYKKSFVQRKAAQMCNDWYNEDGAQVNFIRDTETNSSCPCKLSQALKDYGRFMPHPRCSTAFRDVTCSESLGAHDCYMSAQNIFGSYSNTKNSDGTSQFPTHYGQVCCYDASGFLMQSSYQPVIKINEDTPYSPGFPMRAYEFGTDPYQGQFEVPGLSSFHHDLMPYYLCCKFTDFRCQLFYWRRPTSGCQAYQPPAIGTIMGAGLITTLDNRKLVFTDPGVYTLLYIPQTATQDEVKIQIRLERFPNRRVDFGEMPQEQLVQPTNATVVTGIAFESTGSDRVHVMLRKDTRRARYRTSVLVGNILRYFDTMLLQRYKGVTIYVNNVQRGQAEVYVVLDRAQIGVRIRESYAIDIDTLPDYQESMGLLDIELSLPPKYGINPNANYYYSVASGYTSNPLLVEGLLLPTSGIGRVTASLEWGDVNVYSAQLADAYKISGDGDIQQQHDTSFLPLSKRVGNMFYTSRPDDVPFEAMADAMLRQPVYSSAKFFNSGTYGFRPQTGLDVNSFLQRCQNFINVDANDNFYDQNLLQQCPDNPDSITTECTNDVACTYNYVLLQTKVLGVEARKSWHQFVDTRLTASERYNSCGAINLEYPEYLRKTSTLASAYLDGDVAQFECYQSHFAKGDTEYKCLKIEDYHDPYNNYRFEWTKGWQPWCRSRERDNLFKWMTWIFSILGIITFIMLIFFCCWSVKRNRINNRFLANNQRDISLSGTEMMPPAKRYITADQSKNEKLATPLLYQQPPVYYEKSASANRNANTIGSMQPRSQSIHSLGQAAAGAAAASGGQSRSRHNSATSGQDQRPPMRTRSTPYIIDASDNADPVTLSSSGHSTPRMQYRGSSHPSSSTYRPQQHQPSVHLQGYKTSV